MVINHMTGPFTDSKGTGGSKANASSKSYPEVPYTDKDFHVTCAVNDYQNATNVRNCELVALKDLNQVCTDNEIKILLQVNKIFKRYL